MYRIISYLDAVALYDIPYSRTMPEETVHPFWYVVLDVPIVLDGVIVIFHRFCNIEAIISLMVVFRIRLLLFLVF
jgi:hypothetical protein